MGEGVWGEAAANGSAAGGKGALKGLNMAVAQTSEVRMTQGSFSKFNTQQPGRRTYNPTEVNYTS